MRGNTIHTTNDLDDQGAWPRNWRERFGDGFARAELHF